MGDRFETDESFDALAAALRDAMRGGVHRNHPIGPLTTYRVGGSAAIAVEPEDIADVRALAAVLAEHRVPVASIGQGSNLLVADAGFAGVAVLMGTTIEELVIEGADVTVGAGARLPLVARRTVAAGLTGFEWAVGVPGSIGGAVRMNAGGHGSDMASSVAHAEILDLHTGETDTWQPAQLAFGYRTSALQNHHCVLSCQLTLAAGDAATGELELKEIVRWRREHQPGGQNAGSVFTNPEGDSAGRLIDVCGGKGLRVGSAEISTKHANFIQADENGRADDVVAVMLAAMALVEDRTGVSLHPETQLLGYGDLAAELTALQTLTSNDSDTPKDPS